MLFRSVRVKPEQSVTVGGNGPFRWNKRQRPYFLSASMKVKRVAVGYKDAKKTSTVFQYAIIKENRVDLSTERKPCGPQVFPFHSSPLLKQPLSIVICTCTTAVLVVDMH